MALEDSRRSPGVLWPAAGQDVFDTGRLPLPPPLDLVAGYYWWVAWRHTRPTPFRQQVLSNPVLHLTVEDADGGRLHGQPVPAALVHGVVTRVFTVDLPAAGRVAAVAFQPGGLAALLDTDVGALTDRVVPAQHLFGSDVDALAELVLTTADDEARRDAFADHLSHVLEPQLDRVRGDRTYATVRAAVDVMRGPEHVSVGSVADQLHVSARTLQRAFARYVGASPLWVLRRFRLQEAAAAIDAGRGHDLAALAASLGFSDHAHFTRAFTEVIGAPPSRYRRGSAPDPPDGTTRGAR